MLNFIVLFCLSKEVCTSICKKCEKSLHLFPLPLSPGAATVTAWGVCLCFIYMHLLTWVTLYLKPSKGSCSSYYPAANYFLLAHMSQRTFPAWHMQVPLSISMAFRWFLALCLLLETLVSILCRIPWPASFGQLHELCTFACVFIKGNSHLSHRLALLRKKTSLAF